MGDHVTHLDLWMFEQSEFLNLVYGVEKFAEKYPTLAAHHKRVAALPKVAAFIASDKFIAAPFNNTQAKVNN